MRFIHFILVSLLTPTGCIAHRDFLTNFRVQGIAAFTGPMARQQSPTIEVQLIDDGMDYVRSKKRSVFASFHVTAGQPFTVDERYFWGSTKRNASQQAALTVRVIAVGCNAAEQQHALKDLHREGQELVVDIGSILLRCDK